MLGFRDREPPLPPVAVAGRGPARQALLAALMRPGARLAGLEGVAGPEVIVVAGPDLPWADGLHWLGADPAAPHLWCPTTLAPTIDGEALPVELIARRLLATQPPDAAPLVLLPDPLLLVPFGAARPLDLDWLKRWAR